MILVAKCDICKKDSDYNSKDIDQTFCWFLKTPFKDDRREMIQLKIVSWITECYGSYSQ